MLNPKKIFLSKKNNYKIIELKDEFSENFILNEIAKYINNGTDVIELRNINLTQRQFIDISQKIRELSSFFDVALIIYNNIDIAKLVDADGITIDETSFTISEVKKLAEETLLIGYVGISLNAYEISTFDFVLVKEIDNNIKILQFVY